VSCLCCCFSFCEAPYVERVLSDRSCLEGRFVGGTGFGTRSFNVIEAREVFKTWTGSFKDYRLHEEGSIEFNTGRMLEGVFEKGFLVRGKDTLKDGTVLQGVFENCQLVSGSITSKSGIFLQGVFESGMLVKGMSKSLDGITREGIFKKGKLVEGKKTLDNGFVFEGKFEDEYLVEGTVTSPNGRVNVVSLL